MSACKLHPPEALRGRIRAGLAPRPRETVSEWADQNRVLSSMSSSEAGRWRTSRVPFAKEIMDCLSAVSSYTMVVFQKGHQIAGTETLLNWIGYTMHSDPGPMLTCMPTVDMTKDMSKRRLDPMIQASPALRETVREQQTRDARNTARYKEFPGGYWTGIGANAPGPMSSNPIEKLGLDEIDSYPEEVGSEGNPIELMIARTSNFPNRKVYLASTPKKPRGLSHIERRFLETDQRYFHIPCPGCKKPTVLEWSNIRWEKGKPETAHHLCPHCGYKARNHEKAWMLPRGKWIATNEEFPEELRGKVAGFHLSSLYSPVGWNVTWEYLARTWEKIQGDPVRLRNFVQLYLAQTYVEHGEAPEWEQLHARCSPSLKEGTVPEPVLFLTVGVDCQVNRIEAIVDGWTRDRQSYVIAHRVFPGDTANATGPPWRMLTELLHSTFPHSRGFAMPILLMAVDSGYRANTVYDWCRRQMPGRAVPVKGREMPVMVSAPRTVDIKTEGRVRRNAVLLYTIGSGLIKEELYGWAQLRRNDDGTFPRGYLHFPQLPEDFFKQFCSEQLTKTQTRSGAVKFEWVKTGANNEVLDMKVYSRAAAAIAGMDRWKDADWDRIESELEDLAAGSTATPRKRGRRRHSAGIQI